MAREKTLGVRENESFSEQDELSSGLAFDFIGIGYSRTGIITNTVKKKGSGEMKKFCFIRNKKGMEMVQVAILVAIAVALGLIFKSQITEFVNNTFQSLSNAKF